MHRISADSERISPPGCSIHFRSVRRHPPSTCPAKLNASWCYRHRLDEIGDEAVNA
jgi:hypothetical protein